MQILKKNMMCQNAAKRFNMLIIAIKTENNAAKLYLGKANIKALNEKIIRIKHFVRSACGVKGKWGSFAKLYESYGQVLRVK